MTLLNLRVYIVMCQAHPVIVKKGDSNVDGRKDPWPRVLSLPGWFVGDPASRQYLASDCQSCSIMIGSELKMQQKFYHELQ